ncbi:MAG: radical SAM family heme chaperone HemW [Verrucomicrobiota bacterium]
MHLYFHIPFCHRVCPYCSFYKHRPGKLANEAFVHSLLAQIDQQHPDWIGRPIQTVYWGGGTPTLLSGRLITQLAEGIQARFDLSGCREWTLEANPATFGKGKARSMIAAGVNRISLGVQSFQPDTLKTLGRDHSGEEARSAFQTLREVGFENISVDLMFSIPGQTPESWKRDLDTAIALEPDHISAYNLTYEEDTDFLARHISGELDADEDRDAILFENTIDRLAAAGYAQYEVSNYARPGFESQHNQAYWQGADYLGLGPGAVSTVEGRRWTTLPDTATYIQSISERKDTKVNEETLSKDDRRLEAIALRLRTEQGCPVDLIGLDDGLNRVEPLTKQGLIELKNGQVRLTRAGKSLADPIACELV